MKRLINWFLGRKAAILPAPDDKMPAPPPMPESSPAPSDVPFVRIPPSIPWHTVVLMLDGIDEIEKAEIPLAEYRRFLKTNSRFALKLTFLKFDGAHDYTYAGEDKYHLYWSALPQKWLDQIPPCSSVLALYKLNGRSPLYAGSTWALRDGIAVNGKLRTFASIPTDMPWFVNEPYEGFDSHGAQITTHELNNTIQGKLEAPPYNCGKLIATDGDPAYKHESDRIKSIKPSCYAALGRNED